MLKTKVKLLAYSVAQDNPESKIATFQLRYWRPIHSELMTHRVFSRNAGSSRARPSAAIIEQVFNDPWGPIHWGANQPGMQANTELDPVKIKSAQNYWKQASYIVASIAENMVEVGVHKQIVNRILEPFTYIDVVVTATDFNNWFALRDHPDAQPEIQELARMMKAELEKATPEVLPSGMWHLPYITDSDWRDAEKFCQKNRVIRSMPSYDEILEVVRKVSVARCARVSYKAHDGTNSPIEDDIALFGRLLVSQPLHASPAEHQATPDIQQEIWDHQLCEDVLCEDVLSWENPKFHGNFTGWIQYRKMLPNEYIPG